MSTEVQSYFLLSQFLEAVVRNTFLCDICLWIERKQIL